MVKPHSFNLRPNRITTLRKERGMTMQNLADRANVTRGPLGNLERGERELTKPVMDRIASLLGCLPADILNESDGGLVAEERKLIEAIRSASPDVRSLLHAVAGLIGSK